MLTGSRRLDDDLVGDNVTVLPLNTVDGQRLLLRCARILVDSEPNLAVKLPLAPSRHDFVHLGVGLPSLAHAASADPEGEWRKLRAMAVASQADALVRAAAEPDLELSQMWATGLPRHDVLLSSRLPDDLAVEEVRIRERVGGRRLVVWWTAEACAHTADEVARIGAWAREHDVAIGVREPRVDRRDGWTRAFADQGVVTFNARTTPWSSLVHRVADAVVTDRVAEAFDALVLGTPLIQYAARRDDDPRGSVEAVFEHDGWSPVERVPDTDALLTRLQAVLEDGFSKARVDERSGVVPLDGQAAWRFTQRVRALNLS